MCTAGSALAGDAPFAGASDALRAAGAALDYVNSAEAARVGSFCGELLIALGEIQTKLTAAHAAVLRRFDAADAHDADGYGSSSAWLAAKAGMSRQGARAAVRQMRQLTERPLLGAALAAGDITGSLAFTIVGWTRKLPPEMRTETDKILLDAAAAGRRRMTWPPSRAARSSGGASSSPAPTSRTTGSTTAACSWARPSAGPRSCAAI
jgi:hypothetical protein